MNKESKKIEIDESESLNSSDATKYQSGDVEAKLDPGIQKNLEIISDLKQEIKDSKKDFLLIFGVFASFVTFLSLEIQIFKTVDNFWLIVGLTSFILSAVLLFGLILQNITKEKSDWKMFCSPAFVILMVFLLFSFFGFWKSSNLEKSKAEPTCQTEVQK